MLHGPGTLLAELARSSLHLSGGTLADIDPADHAARLSRLFLDAPLINDGAVVEYDAVTGAPLRVLALSPVLGPDDQLLMLPQTVYDAADGPAPEPNAGPTASGYVRLDTYGPVTAAVVRLLGDHVRIRFDPDGKAPAAGSPPTASRARYVMYSNATTIGAYRELHAWDHFRRPDLQNDLKAGLALVHSDDIPVALLPAHSAIRAMAVPSHEESARTAAALAAQRAARPPPGPPSSSRLGADLDHALQHFARMQRLEGTADTDCDDASEQLLSDVIGDERLYTAAYGTGIRILRAGLDDDYAACASPPPPSLPMDPGVAREAGRAARDAALHTDTPAPASVRQALRHPDCDGPGGWKEAISKEIRRVEHFGAWKLVPGSTYHGAIRSLGKTRVSLGFIVCVLKQKTDPNGIPTTRKGRVTLSDPASADVHVDSYSACVDDITDRVIAGVALRLGLECDVADVSGAYFHGHPVPASRGGRELYAVVPPWLSAFGNYPTHDARGRPNYLFMAGNFPGRRDAGPNWQRVYDAFLLNEMGMRQSVVDRRLFVKVDGSDILLLLIHVDDTKLWYSRPEVRAAFLAAWAAKFNEPPAKADTSEFFVGIRSQRATKDTIHLTCVGVIKTIESLIEAFPVQKGYSVEFPMPVDGPRLLRDAPPDPEPLPAATITLARRLTGAIGFVATHVRADAYFPFCVLSRYQGDRLSAYAFKLIVRLGHYLVNTMYMPLILHVNEAEKGPWGSDGIFEVFCDSSHGNAPDGHSYGGFVLMHRGGGALAWKCRKQASPTDSPGAQELLIASLAYRWTLGLRMLLADLELGYHIQDPTPLWTDSQTVLDGTHGERLGKSSRWLATRRAMIRVGEERGTIDPRKLDGAEMVADIVTKALGGTVFKKHRATILGLLYAPWREDWSVESDAGTVCLNALPPRALNVQATKRSWVVPSPGAG